MAFQNEGHGLDLKVGGSPFFFKLGYVTHLPR